MSAVLDPAVIDELRDLIADRFGLHFDDGKLDLLADVLRARIAARGRADADDYLAELRRGGDAADLVEALTVGETFFFRNAEQFRALAEVALPARIRARASSRQLRVLSAGCATGEEPYSLAMMLDRLPAVAGWDVQIVGVDLNRASLARARHGRYSPWSLRATPADLKRRYFGGDHRELILDAAIRDRVSFEEVNLADPAAPLWHGPPFDLILCRNVLMYFTPAQARAVVARLGAVLVPGGYLLVGHAETLRGLSHAFHLCHTHDTFYYQRRDGEAAPAATAASAPMTATPPAIAASASWVEAIQRSTERVSALTDERAPAPRRRATQITPAPARPGDLDVALELLGQERFAEALERLRGLPAGAQRDPEVVRLRAVLLTNRGERAAAEDACRALLDLDGLDAGAHYLMALCREHAGDLAGAVDHDHTARELDPGFAMPHVHLGLLARRRGDGAAAVRALDQALDLLLREDAARILLFGGGFGREALRELCRAERRLAGGER